MSTWAASITSSIRESMRKMRPAILAVIVLIGAASGAQTVTKPGSGMNGARCEAAWATVSPNDGTIDANEFMAGCKGGLIKPKRKAPGSEQVPATL
jgi:hypothetical protein